MFLTRTTRALAILTTAWVALAVAHAGAVEISGYVSLDPRAFPGDPLYPDQHETASLSVSAQPEVYVEWARGDQSLLFVPFFRYDQQDSRRTHVDAREAFYLLVGDTWELRAGLQKVFWGVTESQHLVDVINQTDGVEDVDGEDKLGQPSVSLALIHDWGTLDLYLLPGFRERTFPGREGRLRPPLYVDTDLTTYESDAEEWHVDWAARWSHTLGAFDLGLSHFSGTNREPEFNPTPLASGEVVLAPHYSLIDQTGVDVQAITAGWLWKLEAINRYGQGDRFAALTGGFEYTFSNIRDTGIDVGVLGEYLWDERGDDGTSPFEDDLFAATRIALNDVQDTAILAGVMIDRDTQGASALVEASRRVGDAWKLSLETRSVFGTDESDPLHAFRQDDTFRVDLARYF